MIVRKLRLQRGWSQEQLAEMAGLSTRTVQRVERGKSAGLESLKSLAAVFEVDVSTLQPENTMSNSGLLADDERDALEYVRNLKDLYYHILTYLLVIVFLAVINLVVSPGYLWFLWAALGWGVGLASHAITVLQPFKLFGPDWEKRQVEKRLGRKL